MIRLHTMRFTALFFFFLFATRSAFALALMNGSVLTVNGLTMTVSGCSIILAGVTQSSCAAGHLLLQALSGPSGTGFSLAGDGTGGNGSDVLTADEMSGLTQLSFTLSIAPQTAGSREVVTSAALTIHGTVPDSRDLANVSAYQQFSAAAGGGSMHLVPSITNNGSVDITDTGTFSISNTFALNSTTFNSWGTLRLSTVQATFATVPEPNSVIVLLTGIAGLAAVRSRPRWRRVGKADVASAG